MKTLLFAAILSTTVTGIACSEVPAGGIWALYNSCDVSAGIFLSPGGGKPKKECAYPLGNVVVLQKVTKPDGYLLAPDTEMGDAGSTVMFLRTSAEYPQHARFSGEIKVKWIGNYQYESIDGFKQNVLAFDPVKAK